MKTSNQKIWSDVINEENLCEGLSAISAAQQRNSRDIESYEYKGVKPKESSNIAIPKVANNKQDVKSRIGPKTSFNSNKTRVNINVSELDSEEAVTRAIVRGLNEPKSHVISKCVKVLGKKKALELLYATEDIIEKGGLPTLDGDRKRTPGGVFFQMLKKDDTILNCQRAQIFSDEMLKKKKAKAVKRLKKRQLEAKEKGEKKRQSTGDESKTDEQQDNENEDDIDQMNEDNMIYFDE